MISSDKRMEAIAELYESERYYLKDLDIWIGMIRNNILGVNNLSPGGKYSSCSSILSHITVIYDLHMEIFQKLKEKNISVLKQNRIKQSTSSLYGKSTESAESIHQSPDMFLLRQASTDKGDLEYYSIYSSLFSSFSCYLKYFENLPKSEYYFKKLMFTDEYFGKIVRNYMKDNNVMDLGINHFMYRPSAKISRYPIFFNAIAKQETDPQKKKEYEKVSGSFDQLIKHLESVFNNRKAQFDTFILSYRFVFSNEVSNKFSLGLIYKKNRLISSRKIIVKKDRLKPASYKDVYLFNRMILICLTSESEFENIVIDDDPIFLSKLYLVKRGIDGFAPNENLEMLYPLFLVQKKNKSIKALYFSDETNREIFYKSARQAIRQVRGSMDKNIKITEILRHKEGFKCVCKPESGRNSFISSYGGDDQQDSDESSKYGEYSEYHINNQEEGKDGDYVYAGKDINTNSRDTTNVKISSSNTREISSGRHDSHSESGDRQSSHATDSEDSIVFDGFIDSHIPGRKHDSVVRPDNTAVTDSLSREDAGSGNVQKYVDSECEKSDFQPLQEISDDMDSNQIYFDGLDTLNRSSSNHIEYNFDNFGAEDDMPSDASSISSKTYFDIFPEETDEVFDVRSTQSSSSTQTEYKKKSGFFSEIFKNAAMPLNQINVECSYRYEKILRNRLMLIYSNMNGIFRALNREQTREGPDSGVEDAGGDAKIHDEPAEKILYDPDLELLIFHSGDYAYVSGFHVNSVKLEPQRINTTIKGFFYGKFKGTAYIALVTNEEYSFSIIHLLKVEYNRELSLLEIKVVRKLYVGFTIFNISFLKGRIIISCKDFEVIEIDTLRTQELLEVYDTSISLLLGSKEYFLARSIFKLDINTFLLCFNGGGYLIDRTGRYKHSNVSFSWEILGEEFKVFRKWIIVVGRSYVTIFEMETGKMIFMEYMPGMRLVEGAQTPLIYSEKSVYLVDFGESCKDEYEKHKIYSFGNIPESNKTVSQCSGMREGRTVGRSPSETEVSGAHDLKTGSGVEASVGEAIDNLFFQSFSSQSLRSAPSTNWDSTMPEHNNPVVIGVSETSMKKGPKSCDETTSSGNAASNYHTTHKVDLKKFRELYKKYTPSNTGGAADICLSPLEDAPLLSRKPISQRSRRLLHEISYDQNDSQRSFKLEPRGNYKVCMPQSSSLSGLVQKARERKMKTLKKYGEKKRKMWRERNLERRNGKIDEMDIIDKYEE